MSKIIGIDLGTSNTAAAVMEGGRPTIIPSAEGSSIGGKAFPSYVAFTKDGQRLVGEPARRQAVSNPEGTATAFKRRMGESYKFNLRGNEFTPQQLSAFILQKVFHKCFFCGNGKQGGSVEIWEGELTHCHTSHFWL